MTTIPDPAAVEAVRCLRRHILSYFSEDWFDGTDSRYEIYTEEMAAIITDAYAEQISRLCEDVDIGCRWLTAFDKVAVAAGMGESWVESNPEHAGDKVVSHLIAEREVREKLVEVLGKLVVVFSRAGENANDKLERIAELFYTETGVLHPSKDIAAAVGEGALDRRAEYNKWFDAKVSAAYAALAEAEKQE